MLPVEGASLVRIAHVVTRSWNQEDLSSCMESDRGRSSGRVAQRREPTSSGAARQKYSDTTIDRWRAAPFPADGSESCRYLLAAPPEACDLESRTEKVERRLGGPSDTTIDCRQAAPFPADGSEWCRFLWLRHPARSGWATRLVLPFRRLEQINGIEYDTLSRGRCAGNRGRGIAP